MPDAITTVELTKRYGKARGIESLSLSIPEGSMFGFLGPNGSGKTTAIRCLLDLLKPTSGEVFLFGKKIGSPDSTGANLRREVGYVAGEVRLFENETGGWHISHIEALRNQKATSVGDLIDSLGFDPSRKVRTLSKGNKQKLAIILALMCDPRLLILDEPTSGLDPLSQEIVFDSIAKRVDEGATLFLSSHLLYEVERVCKRVAIIREGRLVLEDDVSTLLDRRLRRVDVTFEQEVPSDFLSGLPGMKEVRRETPESFRISVSRQGIDSLLKRIAEREVTDITVGHASLEDTFLEFYKAAGEVPAGDSTAGMDDEAVPSDGGFLGEVEEMDE